MINKISVEDKMSELLRNEISLEQFENWLSSASWSMHIDSAPEAIDLVSSIHHILSERDDRVIDEAGLLNELRSLRSSVTYASVLVGEPTIPYFVDRWSARPSFPVLSSAQA